MDILGIGLPEFGLILVIVFLVLAPKDMASTAKRIARTIRALTQSEMWRSIREAWKMAQDIPNELLHEAGLEEAQEDLSKFRKDLNKFQRELTSPITLDAPQQIAATEEENVEIIPAIKEPETITEPSND
jgi:Sec-independent protein translocase protein TatA